MAVERGRLAERVQALTAQVADLKHQVAQEVRAREQHGQAYRRAAALLRDYAQLVHALLGPLTRREQREEAERLSQASQQVVHR